MVAPQKSFFAPKDFFGVAGLKKIWGVSLGNHFMDSFTSSHRPQ